MGRPPGYVYSGVTAHYIPGTETLLGANLQGSSVEDFPRDSLVQGSDAWRVSVLKWKFPLALRDLKVITQPATKRVACGMIDHRCCPAPDERKVLSDWISATMSAKAGSS